MILVLSFLLQHYDRLKGPFLTKVFFLLYSTFISKDLLFLKQTSQHENCHTKRCDETFHLISMSFIPWYDDFLSIMQKNQQKSIFWLFKHDLLLNGWKLLYDRVDLFCREFYALSFDTHVFYTLIWRFFEKNAKNQQKSIFGIFKRDLLLDGSKLLHDRLDLFCREF